MSEEDPSRWGWERLGQISTLMVLFLPVVGYLARLVNLSNSGAGWAGTLALFVTPAELATLGAECSLPIVMTVAAFHAFLVPIAERAEDVRNDAFESRVLATSAMDRAQLEQELERSKRLLRRMRRLLFALIAIAAGLLVGIVYFAVAVAAATTGAGILIGLVFTPVFTLAMERHFRRRERGRAWLWKISLPIAGTLSLAAAVSLGLTTPAATRFAGTFELQADGVGSGRFANVGTSDGIEFLVGCSDPSHQVVAVQASSIESVKVEGGADAGEATLLEALKGEKRLPPDPCD